MMIYNTLFGVEDRVKMAIERYHKYLEYCEGEPYYLAFSGGKDSCVIKALADEAGVPYDAHYSITGIDPPEVVYFIRKYHPDVVHERPKETFLRTMGHIGAPNRKIRWCCKLLKEKDGVGRVVVTGVRRSESLMRSRRELFFCNIEKYILNPIIDWSTEDVWHYIRDRELPYCELYDQGWTRIGCIFCPFASPEEKQRCRDRYPKIEENFRRAFRRLHELRTAQAIEKCKPSSVRHWVDGDEMFDAWISGTTMIKKATDQEVLAL